MSTRNFVVKNGLTVGNVTIDAASGNVVANSVQAGNIRTNNLLYANGTPWDLQQAAGSNTQIQYNDNNDFGASANFTFNSATNTLGVTGNANISTAVNTPAISSGTGNLTLTANTYSTVFDKSNGNVNFPANVTAPTFYGNIVGNISGNITVTGSNTGVVFNDSGLANSTLGFTFDKTSNAVTANGNLTVNNANLGNLATANYVSGTLTTAAQPNITSVGNLTSLDVTGNVASNNLSTTNSITAGNGLSVTTGALSVLAGNLDVTGNLNVTGNVNYSNVTDLVVGDPLIFIGANNAGDTYDLGIVAEYNNGVSNVHTGIARNAADDYWTFFDGVTAQPTTVVDWANATYPTVKMGQLITTSNANIDGIANITGNAIVGGALSVTGTATAGNVYANSGIIAAQTLKGDGGNISNIQGGNVSGAVASANNATTAGTVTSAAQSNITSVGTLTSLTVSGTSNVANLNASGAIVANGNVTGDYILGNGAFLTGIDATSIQNGSANVRTFANANVTISAAGTANVVVVTGTGANIDGYLAVTGNVSGNVFSGNGSGLSAIAGANVTGTVANATYATSAGTAGTVTTNAQPNITSVGTLANLSVTGNLSAGNVDGGNLVSANYVSGTLTTAAQPNITSVGSLTSLDVTGNVTANYVSTVGFSSDRANVSVSSGTVIDQFAPSTFRTAKYVISASGDDGYQSVETLLVHDGVDAYITIYGSVCSNVSADIIDVTANINGVSGNVALYATAGGANVIVNVVASYIKT